MKTDKKLLRILTSILVICMMVAGTVALSPPQAAMAAVTSYESYTAYDGGPGFSGNLWLAQTFTASSNHYVTAVNLRLNNDIATPYTQTITVSIRDATGGVLTGSDLCSGTISGTEIQRSGLPGWYSIPMTTGSPYALTSGSPYAIVVRGPASSGYVSWYSNSTGGYEGGSGYQSVNYGATWVDWGDDHDFQIVDTGSAPVVLSMTPTDFTSASTSHSASMPGTVNEGDLLIALFQNSYLDQNTSSVNTPSGWTLMASSTYSYSGVEVIRLSAYYKKAEGSEGGGTVDFQTTSAQQAAAHVYRITKWNGTIPPAISAAATGFDKNPDPGPLDPGWGAVYPLDSCCRGVCLHLCA